MAHLTSSTSRFLIHFLVFRRNSRDGKRTELISLSFMRQRLIPLILKNDVVAFKDAIDRLCEGLI